MLKINQYIKVSSLDEANDLLKKNRNNHIIGGMMWLKMQDRTINCAIDLSELHLNTIEESEDEFKIGCMTSLRDIETHEGLNQTFHQLLKNSVKDIVGVQFRNMATLGGSIYSRFGFSDILTALLVLDTYVILHQQEPIPLSEYINQPYRKELLTHIIIKKEAIKPVFMAVRKSATDLSVLNLALSKGKQWRLAIGSRPKKAILIQGNELNDLVKQLHNLSFEDNFRASKAYREHLAEVLFERAAQQVEDIQC